MNFKISLVHEKVNYNFIESESIPKIYTPGEKIIDRHGFMRGHGTYMVEDDINASLAGVMEQINRLVSIKPLRNRYCGDIGDVIVGRIIDVQQKKWKVDTNSKLDSTLQLSAINLPGGELRKRGIEDEHGMRKYLKEGDVISAEIQNVNVDGSLQLHTRSMKYGKLSEGVLLKVPPTLIMRRKNYFHNLPEETYLILGTNGLIWITSSTGTAIKKSTRQAIGRIHNCIQALVTCRMMLYDTSILYAFEESKKYKSHELLKPEPIYDIGFLTHLRLKTLE